MTQRDRIKAVLDQYGHVSPVDFLAPNVVDGGAPILRVAARVEELRAAGLNIQTLRLPNGTAQYVLRPGGKADLPQADASPLLPPDDDSSGSAASRTPSAEPALFDDPAPKRSNQYDPWREAA